MQQRRIMALDYGTQRIGVAVSYGTLAEPLQIIHNSPTVVSEVAALISEYGVTELVVGISESKTAERTIAFIAELQKLVKTPIQLVDETLSTQIVRRKLKESGKTAYEAQTAVVDHLAAAEFLQDWIDSQ